MDEGLAELLYKALASKLGIVIRTTTPELLRTQLYSTRKELKHPQLEVRSIKPSHTLPNSELWIVRKTLNQTESPDGPQEP